MLFYKNDVIAGLKKEEEEEMPSAKETFSKEAGTDFLVTRTIFFEFFPSQFGRHFLPPFFHIFTAHFHVFISLKHCYYYHEFTAFICTHSTLCFPNFICFFKN